MPTSDTRFTITLTLRDNYRVEQPLCMSIPVDQELRISERAVEEMKAGLGTFNNTVELMKRREFRKDLFIKAAQMLARQMAERMEDAEGWHDTSRIELARKSFGGKW